ncbi:hypothetical protein I7I50_00698 [Histoplasma capsulatum G186AR]|uniref:Uncharacterized protein n=1 Tax=Ajellomyces capsulatus TaxID=5037 RepID=A0A8H7YEB5_AJECA|nr:hypothetical protein I7I52_07966 [Histoplasma capsulatum]QSS72757.1 hypothetical protein I7I50_00698 [Histoplasma capsulatum G186AR]
MITHIHIHAHAINSSISTSSTSPPSGMCLNNGTAAGPISPTTPAPPMFPSQGPLSSSVAPCTASARFSVSTSKSVTYASRTLELSVPSAPPSNFRRTSNSLSSIISSFQRRRWPSKRQRTRFFIFILLVGLPQDGG